MNNPWFTSDLHFYHKKIVEYTNRGVDTDQENHDKWLIDLWNRQVHPSDIVFQLGDFCFNRRKLEDILKITRQLNGKIVCIKGNHCDRDAMKKTGMEFYDQKLKTFTVVERKQQIVMNHFAMEIWENKQHGAWHLFGHSHGSFQPAEGKRVDVGLDNAYNLFGEHRFFTLEDLDTYMSKRPLVHLDHHSERTNP